MVLRQNNPKILNIVLSENDDSYLVLLMYSWHGGCLQGLVVITMCLTQCKVCREICSCQQIQQLVRLNRAWSYY